MSSVREYAILYIGGKTVVGGAIVGGGNAVLETGVHALDGPEHAEATLVNRLLSTVDHSGLLRPLSGDALEFLAGDGNWATPTSTGSPLWFNVKDYGAVGDDTTDDTAAINLAIAALIAAGRGVLYFPAGTYKVTAALTTLSVPFLVLGDGPASYDNAVWQSKINFTSQTAVCFTSTSKVGRFEKIAIVNTFAGTPSAGAAVLADAAYLEARTDFEGCSFQGFYDNLDLKVWAQSTMHACFNIAPVRYGARLRNTQNVDAGDNAISDCNFSAQSYDSDAAIRIESSGGIKITSTKINMALDGKKFNHGIDLAVAASVGTSQLMVTNSSIENVRGDGIHGTTTAGSSLWQHVMVEGCQFGLFSNNTGKAISLVATTASDFDGCVVIGNVFRTDGTARGAIQLTNVNNVLIGPNVLYGNFTSYYTATTSTNVRDYTGGVAAGVSITGTPTVGDIPIATSGTAAAWGAASSGYSQATVLATGWMEPVIDDGTGAVVSDESGPVMAWTTS